MHALVVDTDTTRVEALRGELERHGHEVTVVASGAAALHAAAELGPRLAAVGWRVGREAGTDICAALLAAAAADEPPIAVLVGAGAEVDAAAAVRAGATDVWSLPNDSAGGLGIRLALAEHHARVQVEHVRLGGELALLRDALDLTGIGLVLTDPRLDDNPIVYANQSFYDLTGYAPSEVIGRNCRFLQGDHAAQTGLDALRAAIARREPVTAELVNVRRDGTPFINEVHIAPVRDDRGEVVRFVGVQIDVSAYRAERTMLVREQGARRAAELAGERSAFLAAASPLLDAALDLPATLDQLARLSVPWLADACLVDVYESGLGYIRRIGSAARDPLTARLLRELPPQYPVGRPTVDPIARVLSRGRAEAVVGDEAITALGPLDGAAGLRATAAMLVPLRARGQTLGVLVLLTFDAARTFDEDELDLAADLGRRAALALDNARLFEDRVRIAETLQRSLLPEQLPQVAGITLAARFLPAGSGDEVGGDFYDAVDSGDSLRLVIGDVAGKGAGAASLTALSRHTIRAAAEYETAPSDILCALNRALLGQRVDRGKFCTAAMCTLTPLEGTVERISARVAVAGHPLPMVLRADGSVERAGRRGTLLGYIPDPGVFDVDLELRSGDALVLYTDGVTDARTRRDATPRLGEEGVAVMLRELAGADAETIAERLAQAAVSGGDGRPGDDVAVLVAAIA